MVFSRAVLGLGFGAEVGSFGPREEQEGNEDRTRMNSVKEMIGKG
jgi:hypothetical protein